MFHMKKRCIALGIAALGFGAASALAADYPAEEGAVPSDIPLSPDESGLVRNPPNWGTERVAPVTPAAPPAEVATVAPAPTVVAANSVDDFFARYDANHDGVVDSNEARVDPDLMRAFSRADANHDGVLTRDEFQSAAVIAQQDRNSAAGGTRP
jgi:hypothetical protein